MKACGDPLPEGAAEALREILAGVGAQPLRLAFLACEGVGVVTTAGGWHLFTCASR